ncbi:MAG: universal stress protein [Smithella sp.]|nr:universal stress protein [Smithella sp.]
MLNFKNILYAIDLDSEKVSSVKETFALAGRFKSRLHVVYVNNILAGYRTPADHEDAIALRVKAEVPAALIEDIDVVYAALKGDVADEIVKYAVENQINLIVAGHTHRSKLYASMFDSTDVKIIDTTSIPVLVIPEK